MNIEELRYPNGKFQLPAQINSKQIEEWKKDIASFPSEIKALSQNLSAVELNYKYRPEGWSVQQLVHHCADSHMNGFIRHKLTLSEDTPQIKPYVEAKWAEMSDTLNVSVEESIKIIEGIHTRWVVLLDALEESDLKREYIHPQYGINYTLAQSIGNYAWHGKHHLAHIKNALTTKELY